MTGTRVTQVNTALDALDAEIQAAAGRIGNPDVGLTEQEANDATDRIVVSQHAVALLGQPSAPPPGPQPAAANPNKPKYR